MLTSPNSSHSNDIRNVHVDFFFFLVFFLWTKKEKIDNFFFWVLRFFDGFVEWHLILLVKEIIIFLDISIVSSSVFSLVDYFLIVKIPIQAIKFIHLKVAKYRSKFNFFVDWFFFEFTEFLVLFSMYRTWTL